MRLRYEILLCIAVCTSVLAVAISDNIVLRALLAGAWVARFTFWRFCEWRDLQIYLRNRKNRVEELREMYARGKEAAA